MASRATRISVSDHQRLQRLSRQLGLKQQEVLTKALDRFERELLLEDINRGFDALRQDEVAWTEEMQERALWDGAEAADQDPR